MAWQFSVVAAVVRYLRSCRGSEWHGSLSAVPRTLAALALVLDFSLAMLLDFPRACLTMELMQTRLDGEEQS